jgi:hypothetical protein
MTLQFIGMTGNFLLLDDSQIPRSGVTRLQSLILQNYLPAKYFSSKILR